MTDQEPTYHYVKGKGWVASVHESHTFETGGYRVTLIDRAPEVGEPHFKTALRPAEIERALTGKWWSGIFEDGRYLLYIPIWTAADASYRGKIHTVLIDKL